MSDGDDKFSAHVGAINTINMEQLAEKFRMQADIAGFTSEEQDMIMSFILTMEQQQSIHDLIAHLVPQQMIERKAQ